MSQERSGSRVMPSSVVDGFTRALSTNGMHGALAYLNARTRFRFTGIYRPEAPLLRNLYLFDRENPKLNVSGAVSVLEETYCAIACATKASFATPDAPNDVRLRSHTAREAVMSYAGVPIRDASGCVVATLCHFDVRPRLIPPNEISALELVAPVVGDWLQTGRYRT